MEKKKVREKKIKLRSDDKEMLKTEKKRKKNEAGNLETGNRVAENVLSIAYPDEIDISCERRSKVKNDSKIVITTEEMSKKKKKPARTFVTQCRPHGLCDIIQNFSEKQKDDVRSIGFGGLLDLSLPFFPTSMIKWLVKNFNGRSRLLTIDRKRSVIVTANDVCDIFLLPRKGESIVVDPRKKENLDFNEQFKKKFNISSLTSLKELVVSYKDGGDDFKRLFVIYSLSSFLTPTANRSVDVSSLKYLLDVEKISSFDWCSFVLDKLCNGVDNFNRKTSMKNITGCLLVLQIVYLHRVSWRGVVELCSLPLIKHWSKEKLVKRLKEEKEAGNYGQGGWVDSYPISCGEVIGEKKVVDDEVSEVKVTEKNPKFISFQLPDGEMDDEEIKKIAKDDIHETFLLLKRDVAVVTNFHMKKLLKVREQKNEKVEQKQSQSPSSQLNAPCDSQNFFSDVEVHKYIDELVEKFLSKKKLSEGMPSFELLTPENENIVAEVLELNENVGEEKDDSCVDEIKEAISSVAMRRKTSKFDPWPFEEDVGYVSRYMSANQMLFADMDKMNKDILDYCMNEDGSLDLMETLFRCGNRYIVTREDFLSLYPEKMIYDSIINAWCLLLNNAEATNIHPSRFYFSLTHSVYLEKIMKGEDRDCNGKSFTSCLDIWLKIHGRHLNDIEMIFVPVILFQHYFAVVINFRDEKLQYLDNSVHADFEVYKNAVDIVQTQMVIFLKSINHVKADDVRTFEFENIQFKWQSRRGNVDCGVFLMHHLQFFEGTIYSHTDLTKGSIRNALRGQFGISIVLSELNIDRSSMLKSVHDFCMKKPNLIGKKKGKKLKK